MKNLFVLFALALLFFSCKESSEPAYELVNCFEYQYVVVSNGDTVLIEKHELALNCNTEAEGVRWSYDNVNTYRYYRIVCPKCK